jgi:hypothetical protein
LPNPPAVTSIGLTACQFQTSFPFSCVATPNAHFAGTVSNPVITFDEAGVYQIKINADDSDLQTNKTITVTVLPAPTATPTATNTPTPSNTPVPGISNSPTPTVTPSPTPGTPQVTTAIKVSNFICFGTSCSGAINVNGTNLAASNIDKVTLVRTGFTKASSSVTGNAGNTQLIASYLSGVTKNFTYSVVVTFKDGTPPQTATTTISVP